MTIYQPIADCAARDAGAEAELDTRDMATVQALLSARIGLLTCLIDAGWIPPAETAAALEHDTAVMRLVPGSGLENWPAPDPRTAATPVPGGRRTTLDLAATALPQQR